MNILIKLMSIVSLVIAPYIALSGKQAENTNPTKTVYTCVIDGKQYECDSKEQCDSLMNASVNQHKSEEKADW